ncbi:hypothetical protein L6452_25686 [Arctium lappa]|uniref:Uncharacterized protein n=1 Tax=Arctium lappa TaxID=4217 RepID=A0ACB9AAN6_ARCLA|nr:hypothetical protein L6452_25686 [Arctium lappa]
MVEKLPEKDEKVTGNRSESLNTGKRVEESRGKGVSYFHASPNKVSFIPETQREAGSAGCLQKSKVDGKRMRGGIEEGLRNGPYDKDYDGLKDLKEINDEI